MLNLLLIAAGAISVAPQPASPAPRMIGAWDLDVARSELGSEHPAANYRLRTVVAWNGSTLTQTDEAANLAVVGYLIPQARSVLEVTPDGAEHEVTGLSRMPMMPAGKMAATAGWQGDNLVIDAHGFDALGYWTTERRFFLSPDGEKLTELIVSSGSLGDTQEKLVFVRSR